MENKINPFVPPELKDKINKVFTLSPWNLIGRENKKSAEQVERGYLEALVEE